MPNPKKMNHTDVRDRSHDDFDSACLCSAPCLLLLEAFEEMVLFLGFIGQLVSSVDKANTAVEKAIDLISTEDRPLDDLKAQLKNRVSAQEHVSKYRILTVQMALSRGVDNFLTYISELLTLVFQTQPLSLKTKEEVTVEFVLEHSNMNEFIHSIAEQRVERLSYSGMESLHEYLASKLGFELFDDKTERDRVIAIVEARNLVVHNRGIVNARYLNRVPDSTYAEGDNIDLGSEVIDDLEYLMRIALRSDRRAVEKWGLPEKACHDWAGSMRIARATAST